VSISHVNYHAVEMSKYLNLSKNILFFLLGIIFNFVRNIFSMSKKCFKKYSSNVDGI